jgi:hypothetical protein
MGHYKSGWVTMVTWVLTRDTFCVLHLIMHGFSLQLHIISISAKDYFKVISLCEDDVRVIFEE